MAFREKPSKLVNLLKRLQAVRFKFLELLLEAVNFTGYRLIRRALTTHTHTHTLT